MFNMSPNGTTWILTILAFVLLIAVVGLFNLLGNLIQEIGKTRRAKWEALQCNRVPDVPDIFDYNPKGDPQQ
jgi:hypothetical protein